MVELRDPTRHFLPERERRRVLQVRTADLHDVAELLALPRERVPKQTHCGNDVIDDGGNRRHVHCRGEDVVGGLPLVHVVVGVDEAPFSALAAEDFAGAIREHLVHVHVGLRPASRLPDRERELAVVLSGDDFVGGLDDRLCLLRIERLEIEVHLGRRALHLSERLDQLRRHLLDADPEVRQRALRLSAPQLVGRDFDVPERVLLHPRRHWKKPPSARGA